MKVLKQPSLPFDVSVEEALADFRLALVSRFLDDREIALRQQNQAFFQISGAGHEALLLGLARSLRPAYDWFFPYYRDRALALALGVTPTEMLLQAVGAATDPASGGRQMPCHWGAASLNIVSQTSVHREPVPARGRLRGGGALHRPPPDLPGCTAYGDEITYVSLGEGATSEGEFWESAQHRVAGCTSRCSSSSPTTATRSRCGRPTSTRRRSRRWCAASAVCTS